MLALTISPVQGEPLIPGGTWPAFVASMNSSRRWETVSPTRSSLRS